MSSTIYLGKTPRSNQVVSPELKMRNIPLIKAAPGDFKPLVLNRTLSTNYKVYLASLAAFIRTAETKQSSLLHQLYYSFLHKELPSFAQDPDVIWSFISPPNAEHRDRMQEAYQTIDTLAKGKPAVYAKMDVTKFRTLTTVDDPVQTTPATAAYMNLVAYKQYVLLHRLFDTVCRTHQYSSDESTLWGEVVEMTKDSFSTIDHAAVGEAAAWTDYFIATNPTLRAHSNLTADHASFDYCLQSKSKIPSTATGFILPFVSELAQPDYSTPLTVVNRYLKYCLGDDEDEVLEAFERLKTAWSVIANTVWGDELAHMYWCLAVALESGGTLRVIESSQCRYSGCLLLGGNFTITLGGTTYYPANYEALVRDFSLASPHDAAMHAIFSKIFFPGDADRKAALASCSTLHDLRNILSMRGTSEEGREEIRRFSFYLNFDQQPAPLTMTGHNIARVLDAIDNPAIPETSFPIHPPMVLSSSRKDRLWSAFGSIAPSFRVPGGKQMDLSAKFEVVERSRAGDKSSRSIRKIGFVLKSLEEALKDLDALIADHLIMNPHGTSLMARSSSSALVKTLEGEQCDKVVAGLRKVSKVTIMAEASGSGKRALVEKSSEGRAQKKRRVDDV